jgi:hypothetical protein
VCVIINGNNSNENIVMWPMKTMETNNGKSLLSLLLMKWNDDINDGMIMIMYVCVCDNENDNVLCVYNDNPANVWLILMCINVVCMCNERY